MYARSSIASVVLVVHAQFLTFLASIAFVSINP
jgi:hypothetical protein